MAIDPKLTEAKWKSDGLTKRTAAEKVKFKKTGVSEALRDYAKAEALAFNKSGEKEAKLQAVRKLLALNAANHKTNAAFIAYIKQMQEAIPKEARRVNDEVIKATLNQFMSDAERPWFFSWANKNHCGEAVEFLRDEDAGMATDKLIEKYVKDNSPRELNILAALRNAWIAAPANAGAKQKVVNASRSFVDGDPLNRYKQTLMIKG